MRKLRVLHGVLTRTHTYHLLLSYILFVFADALFIWLTDPGVTTYGDALWYCYAVISTAGFGDIVVTSFPAKLASLVLTVYSLFVIAIITGAVVTFFSQMIQIQQKETLVAFADKMEHLPELSREELEDLSKQVIRFRKTLQDSHLSHNHNDTGL